MTFSRYNRKEFIQSKYYYPDTLILKNKLGIVDDVLLREAETHITQLRLYKLQQEPIKGRFSSAHLMGIHKYIFQDIYFFAGKIREENIIKGDTHFCDSRFIHDQLHTVLEKLKKDNFLLDRSPEVFSRDLSTYISELNMIHPFREGNGRALREFIRCLALKCHYELNWDAVEPKTLLQAFIKSKDDITELVDCILLCIE